MRADSSIKPGVEQAFPHELASEPASSNPPLETEPQPIAFPVRQAADSFLVIAGVIVAGLGAAVLAGWHFEVAFLLRVFAGFTPMAYNTALSFTALGIAMGALAFGRRGPARLLAGAAGLIALGRLFQYATGVPQVIETILSRFTLAAPPNDPAPMAPNTASALILAAAAVWLGSAGPAVRWKTTAMAFCGSGVAALGLDALLGYFTGIETYLWANFKPMAVHTSAGLILLGLAILPFSWREHLRIHKDGRSWTLVTIAVVGSATAVAFWGALSSVEDPQVQSLVRLRSGLPEMVLAFGLLLTVLLAIAVYLAQTARLQTGLSDRLRAQAEAALRALGASERKYRTLLETLPQKIVHKDRQCVYVSCNEHYARDLGITPGAIAGKTDCDFYPADLAEKYRADDRRVMDSGETAEIEENYLVNGQRRWVQTVKTPVRDESGTVIGVIVIFWDITDRKRATLELQRANAHNRSLLEASLDPLVAIAPDGKIADVNGATEQATGRSRRELIGTDFSDYFTEPEKAREGYRHVFRKGLVQDYELELRHRDGRVTPVLYNASVYRDEDAKVVGVFAAARDITDRKRAEQALEKKAQDLARSNADLEQFAYVASHDLQEPLRMVANFTQLLADRYRDRLDADGVEFIGYAVDGATRMQRLIQDLLTYSRVGTRGLAFQPTDCNEALGAAVANLQGAIHDTGAVVTHEELPTVRADPSQMAQLFQNLVGNAIKFHGAEAPRVHVSARREPPHWLLTVRDNGIGIDPAFADRIFVIFQRLHSRGEYPGTGIGLALCKKIVERHGGRIWVESKPGQGATFFFTVPGA